MLDKKQVNLHIEGMTCAACSARIEKVLNKIDGVEATVNLATETAAIKFAEDKVMASEIARRIEKLGYHVRTEKAELDIFGMTCAACSNRIEKVLNKMEGVRHASVNLAAESAAIEYEAGTANTGSFIHAIQKLGYDAKEKNTGEQKSVYKEEELKRKTIKFWVSALLSFPLLFTMAGHLPLETGIPVPEVLMNPWIQLALATPVQFIIGAQFYSGAYKSLRSKSANMDVLVALGTSAAYFYSLAETVRGAADPHYHPHLYFETSAVLITLILLGKLFEARAKGRTTEALSSLLNLQAKEATLLEDGMEKKVPIDQVSPGDVLVVKPGERVPVDGTVIRGRSAIDESMITGESIPVEKITGDEAIGATVNKNGVLHIQATRVGKDTALAGIIKAVEEAQGSKAPIQRIADSISGIFVPVVVGISIITFLIWFFAVSPGQVSDALEAAIAVLVIACPCALGLATPTSIMVGTGKGAETGILFKGGEHLETLYKIDTIILDKTGTITEGKPAVTNFSSDWEDALLYLASAEKASEHPLAEAVLKYAEDKGIALLQPDSFEAIPGRGIRASVNGKEILAGTSRLMREEGINWARYAEEIEAYENDGKTAILLAADGKAAGAVAIADTVKSHAAEAVRQLQEQGIEVWMVTGDNEKTARAIARRAGIQHVRAEVLPEGKRDQVSELQSRGRKVGMVGDGINDAPALALADAGIAIGTGTDVAIEAADITILGGDLLLIPKAIKLSRATMRNIRQNLFWALAYNVAGIPIAAFGLLAPWVAGAAMAFSSVSVVSNSLRLKKVKL